MCDPALTRQELIHPNNKLYFNKVPQRLSNLCNSCAKKWLLHLQAEAEEPDAPSHGLSVRSGWLKQMKAQIPQNAKFSKGLNNLKIAQRTPAHGLHEPTLLINLDTMLSQKNDIQAVNSPLPTSSEQSRANSNLSPFMSVLKQNLQGIAYITRCIPPS